MCWLLITSVNIVRRGDVGSKYSLEQTRWMKISVTTPISNLSLHFTQHRYTFLSSTKENSHLRPRHYTRPHSQVYVFVTLWAFLLLSLALTLQLFCGNIKARRSQRPRGLRCVFVVNPSDTGIVRSRPARSMDVRLRFYCLRVVLY